MSATPVTPQDNYTRRLVIVSVVDADTLHVNIDDGRDRNGKDTIRLFGLNAPEMSTPEGKAARLKVVEWVNEADPSGFTIQTIKDKREKYGRYLGIIFRAGDPMSLNDYLLRNGLAVPYYGG